MSLRNRKKERRFTWFKLGLLLVLAAAACSLFTPYPAELVRAFNPPPPPPEAPAHKPKKVHKPKKTATEQQAQFVLENPEPWSPEDAFSMPVINLPNFPPALPERSEPGNYEHVTELTRGLNNYSSVNFIPGTTASQDRKKKDAYQLRVSLNTYLPKAAEGDALLKANPELPSALADFSGLMQAAKVSPWYHDIYLHKQNRVRKNTALLNQLLDRHNFYDTDTVLDIVAPQSNRHVLWIQADMDVVSDGSDGDRLPTMPEKIRKSDYYQPTTSYRWRKLGKTPNPLLEGWQERYKRYTKEGNKEKAEEAKLVIADLQRYSFLLAEYDSFIVIPLTLKEKRNDESRGGAAFRPEPGDYAAVVVGKRVFPAIVGDFGPKFKTGEASLRLSKAVNPKAKVYARPVSDLGVSYIIFPGTKEPENGPIDYARLNSRVRELLGEIGGLAEGAEFVEMQDLLPQPPAP
ncbi:MAG: glycoside hydrolase family 75 protein [Akkermansia sp.]|nr:glycoside hydrolase family 75 protein [Akkermansia sp.]